MKKAGISLSDFEKPLDEFALVSYLDMALEKYNVQDIKNALMVAIEKRAKRNAEGWEKGVLDEINKSKQKFISKPLPQIEGDISKVENKCKWLKQAIKRKNLAHKERQAMLFLYLKFGKEGEQRLKEIFVRQENYKKNICDYQIEYYKKQNNFLGISCDKIKEWGLCNGC